MSSRSAWCFWELLVGRPLFTEDSAVALFRRLHRTDALPPSTLNPEVPTVLDWIVLAMLQHDPARRLQTAAEVQRRIMQAVPGAANRVTAELGALAIDVRDQRAAWRAAQPAAGEPLESSNHISFSPTPRSQLTSAGQPDDNAPNSSARTCPGPPTGGSGAAAVPSSSVSPPCSCSG